MNDEDLRELLCENLRSLMAEIETSESRWAKDAGLSHTAVRDILSGKTRHPTYRVLVALANAAKVDVRRITFGPDYLDEETEIAETLSLLHQLKPEVREFLLNAARAQVASQDRPAPKPDASQH